MDIVSEQSDRIDDIHDTGIELDVVANTSVYRCGLLASYSWWPITPFLFSHGRLIRITAHSHPAHREIAQSFVPAALVLAAIEQDLVKDHVDSAGDEVRHRPLKSREQAHEVSPALELALDDLDSTCRTNHLDRKCPHQQIDAEKEPITIEAGLKLPGQRRLSGARSAIESQ